MEISTLIVRIAFLAFPGIIAARIYRLLRGRREWKAWEDFTEVLFFAVASYLAVDIVRWAWLRSAAVVQHPGILDAFVDDKVPLQWPSIAYASLAALVLAPIASLAYYRAWLPRVARQIGVTNRTGYEDIWSYLHSRPTVKWVVVRDHKLNLIYFGRLVAYSDPNAEREIILSDVEVHSNVEPARLMYKLDVLYISRAAFELSIEVPEGALVTAGDGQKEKKKWRKRKNQTRSRSQ